MNEESVDDREHPPFGWARRTCRFVYRTACAATWGQRLVLLLCVGLATGVACLLPGAVRGGATGLATLLALFVVVAGLGVYLMGRALLDEPGIVIEERPLPAAFGKLPLRVQATIEAARRVEDTARHPQLTFADVEGALIRWETALYHVGRSDRRFLRTLGVDADELASTLREVIRRGSREECVEAARDYERRVLDGALGDPMRRGG